MTILPRCGGSLTLGKNPAMPASFQASTGRKVAHALAPVIRSCRAAKQVGEYGPRLDEHNNGTRVPGASLYLLFDNGRRRPMSQIAPSESGRSRAPSIARRPVSSRRLLNLQKLWVASGRAAAVTRRRRWPGRRGDQPSYVEFAGSEKRPYVRRRHSQRGGPAAELLRPRRVFSQRE
jgi:hypothetical protein